MKAYKITFGIAISVSSLNLAAGFLYAGYWMVALVILPVILFMIIFWQRNLFWLGTAFLSTMLLLAAIGVLLQIPFLPMIVASTAALATWDLYLFKKDVDCITPEGAKPALIKDHITSVGLAISSGFLLAVTISYLKIKLSFGITVLIVLLTMFCLMFSVQTIYSRNR